MDTPKLKDYIGTAACWPQDADELKHAVEVSAVLALIYLFMCAWVSVCALTESASIQ